MPSPSAAGRRSPGEAVPPDPADPTPAADARAALTAADPDDMLGTVERSPEQWREALAGARETPELAPPRNVVVAGMGGSGISGDVGAVLADVEGTLPVVAVKGYRLPAWIGADTLVVAVSYSGNTEETLACVRSAAEAGARLTAVTSGGELADRAAAGGWPTVTVPAGRPPRASFPALTTAVAVMLVRAGVLPERILDDLQAVPGHLAPLVERWGRDATDSTPRRLAAELRRALPVFYGGRGMAGLVALRAKCQVNENAERPAISHEIPELDHNEVMGWTHPPPVPLGLVEIRAPDEHPQVAARFAATAEVVGPAFRTRHRHDLVGSTPMARLAAGVLFVDLLSVYLAVADGTDPTPVDAIEDLKARIAR